MVMQQCMAQGLCATLLLWFSSSVASGLPLARQRLGAAIDSNAPPYNFDSGKHASVGHFEPDSTAPKGWPRQRQLARRRLLASSDRHAADLKKWMVDDKEVVVVDKKNVTKDSELWGKLSNWQVEDTTEYWSDLCNGTNMSEANKLPGDVVKNFNVTAVLYSWTIQKNSTCHELINDAVYTDAMKAFKKCGALCDGIVQAQEGVGEKATTKYSLCVLGGRRKKAKDSTVFTKPADFVNTKGPRPPIELDFWADFCKYREKGRLLRVLFEGKNCAKAVVKDMGKTDNPVECSEAAGKDKLCSKVFDFRFGPPPVCRCLLKDKDCAPIVGPGGDVYAPTTAD